MKNLKIGAWIVTLVALITIVGPFAADWSSTHLFSPRWAPHAKLNNSQTMLLGLALGASALWFAWFQSGDNKTNLLAAVFAALYWIAQAGSIAFPGTALFDPEFAPDSALPDQVFMDVVILSALGFGYYLESRRRSPIARTNEENL